MPHAHQIIVVEGACPGAARLATPDGHSTDGTLEAIRDIMKNDDHENKVQLVLKDGFWAEKDEMSSAYIVFAPQAIFCGRWMWMNFIMMRR